MNSYQPPTADAAFILFDVLRGGATLAALPPTWPKTHA